MMTYMTDHHGLHGLRTSKCLALLLALTALLLSAWSPLTITTAAAAAAAAGDTPTRLPKLLLISLDGFGWNFLGKIPRSRIPNFRAVMEKGVHVRWVENVFPTKTVPNHMSMVSGLYPESHGMVNNKFFDPLLNASMPRALDTRYTSQWVDVGAEPIWVTNSKAGSGRRSGTVFWPLSEVKIKGFVPDEIVKQEPGVTPDVDMPYSDRIDVALNWLTSSSSPVNFAAVYTHGVDGISHMYGPDSKEMLDGIALCDKAVGHLLSQIRDKKLEEELNVIITADHGHSAIYPQLMVNIDELLHPSWYTSFPDINKSANIVFHLWPKEGFHDKVLEALRGTDHMNLHVAIKGESKDLEAMHYSHNRRIPPVVLYAEPGWAIGRTSATFKSGKGEHGWDPRYDPYMYPVFMAMGPAFKKDVQNAEPFHIVDIYSLMCHVLGLNPAPNNGSLSRAAHILQLSVSDSAAPSSSSSRGGVAGVIIGVVVILVGVVIIFIFIFKKRRTHKEVTASYYKRVISIDGSAEDLVDDGQVILSDEEL